MALDPEQLRIQLEHIVPKGTIIPDDPGEMLTMAEELGIVAREGVEKMEEVEEFADVQKELAGKGLDLSAKKNNFVIKKGHPATIRDSKEAFINNISYPYRTIEEKVAVIQKYIDNGKLDFEHANKLYGITENNKQMAKIYGIVLPELKPRMNKEFTINRKTIFNLKKMAQEQLYDDFITKPQIEEIPQFQVTERREEIEPPFATGAEFAVWMEGIGNDPITINSIKQNILQDIQDPQKLKVVEANLDDYFNPGISTSEKEKVAINIFDQLESSSWKQMSMSEQGEVMPINYTQAIIDETNDIIKKLAEKYVKKERKKSKNISYNLQKEAQHKGFDTSVFLYGPGEKKFDPFYRQPVSPYSMLERNKGFGFTVDEIWDLDWESIWRGNIMDKYSRPYKDSKTGEWVGGYIQKRFEVDKNIPEQNNLQLKPGQRRKPFLPQYGLTEARMEYMRENEDRGYGPVSEGKVFNWKEAQIEYAYDESKKKS